MQEIKNSYEKIAQKHLYLGELEPSLYTTNDYKIIKENSIKYLELIEKDKYVYTVDEMCKLLEITKMYANTYFLDKLDTLYLTRACKLYLYMCRNKDLKQVKNFLTLFDEKYHIEILDILQYLDEQTKMIYIYNKLKTLNLFDNRLNKKYYISTDSLKNAIIEVFEFELRDDTGEVMEHRKLKELDASKILAYGLVSNNTFKKELNINTDTQLSRIIKNSEIINECRIVVRNNANKQNTVRYINTPELKKVIEMEKFSRSKISLL